MSSEVGRRERLSSKKNITISGSWCVVAYEEKCGRNSLFMAKSRAEQSGGGLFRF